MAPGVALALFIPLLACLSMPIQAASPAAPAVYGVWHEPATGVHVEMLACDGARELLCGRIVRLPPRSAATDVHNADPALRGRVLLGLEIVSGFQPVAANRWQGGGEHGRLPGRIYLPVNGDTLGDHRNRYEIRLEHDRLVISIANCSLLACLGKRVWERVPPH